MISQIFQESLLYNRREFAGQRTPFELSVRPAGVGHVGATFAEITGFQEKRESLGGSAGAVSLLRERGPGGIEINERWKAYFPSNLDILVLDETSGRPCYKR